jgi:hypothetical protein
MENHHFILFLWPCSIVFWYVYQRVYPINIPLNHNHNPMKSPQKSRSISMNSPWYYNVPRIGNLQWNPPQAPALQYLGIPCISTHFGIRGPSPGTRPVTHGAHVDIGRLPFTYWIWMDINGYVDICYGIYIYMASIDSSTCHILLVRFT